MEISPVTFGSNLKARITNVKSFVREAKTVRELERALRDSGLSNNDSLYLISLIKKEGLGQAENDHINDPILNTLKKVNAELTAFKYIEGVLYGR
jgi:hypothetical protein